MRIGLSKQTVPLMLAFAGLAVAWTVSSARGGEDNFAEYNRCMAEGYQLLRNNNPADLPTVIARFRTARRLRFYAGEVDYWMALANYARDSYSVAETDAQNAIKKTGDTFPHAYLLLGQLYLVNRKYDDGIKLLRQAADLYTDELRRKGLTDRYPHKELILAWFNLGRGLYHRVTETRDLPPERSQRDLLEAGQFLASAASRLASPEAPPGLADVAVEVALYRGHCYYAAGAWLDARHRYLEAYNLDAGHRNPEPVFRMGLAARKAQRWNEAFNAFKFVNDNIEALNRQLPPGAPRLPPHAEAYLQLGTLCLKDYPNMVPTARRQLQLFLGCAPPRHPWRTAVADYLKANRVGELDPNSP